MNQPINLIINADDLGAGEPTDRGVIEAFTKGIVSSASLLANGSSFDSAVKIALEAALPTGVHLNLSEGFPVAGPISGLTDVSGEFPGKAASRKRFLAGSISTAALHHEFCAQINKVKAAGLQPDHLDTHQHCGLFPIVTPALISAAADSGIKRLRLATPTNLAGEFPPPLGDELRLYRQLAPEMIEQFRAAGIETPNGLLGMELLNRLDATALAQLLSNLTTGNWELMVHPGYVDRERSFAGTAREHELTALTTKSIKNLIAQHGIKLISFREMPCAC